MALPHRLIAETLDLPVLFVELNFIDPEKFTEEKPYTIAGPLPSDKESRRTNLITAPQKVAIRDLRGHLDLLDIHKNGFEIVTQKPNYALGALSDHLLHEHLYANNIWLRQRLEAEHCFCYAYKVKQDVMWMRNYAHRVLRRAAHSFEVASDKKGHREHTLERETCLMNQLPCHT